MRVVKKVEKRKEKALRWECHQCTSVIESTKSEGRSFAAEHGDEVIITTCPVCEHPNWIDASLFEPKSRGRYAE